MDTLKHSEMLPDNIGLHRFFRIVPSRYWDQVERFFRLRDPLATAQQHYQIYRSSLEEISSNAAIEKTLRLRAKNLLLRLEYDSFVGIFTDLQSSSSKKEASLAVRGLVLDVTQQAALPCVEDHGGPSVSARSMNQARIPLAKKLASKKNSRIPRPRTTSSTPISAVAMDKRVAKRKNSVIAEPWRSILEQLLKKIKGGDVACAEEWPEKLTGLHLKLYKHIESQIQDSMPMSKLAEKDVFVSMSGIVNTRMERARSVFGDETVDQVKAQCLRPGISEPSDKLQTILAPLQEAFRVGGREELLNEVEEALGVEAKARRERAVTDPLKQRVLDAVRHICIRKPSKEMSEGELVEVWSYVINALAGHRLTLRSGELTSKATRWQRMLLQQELDLDAGTATYGRKLDLQCRSEELELNNSEFKVDGTSKQQAEIQYRKNLRVNQAMMLYLREQIGMPLEDLDILALDVHGLSAVLFALRYHESVFVSDLATKHMSRLPDSPASWKLFLQGSTLSVLLTYVDHMVHLTERVEQQELLREQEERTNDRRTPEREPRPLGDFTFFSPSKKRCISVAPRGQKEIALEFKVRESYEEVREEDESLEGDDVPTENIEEEEYCGCHDD